MVGQGVDRLAPRRRGDLPVSELSDLESGERDRVRAGWLIRTLCNLGGKWTVALLLGLLGAGVEEWGALQAARGKE